MKPKQETVPLQDVPLEQQHEILVRNLGLAREIWLPAHVRAQRAGGWSAEANAAETKAMNRIDTLLEALSTIMIAETLESDLANS